MLNKIMHFLDRHAVVATTILYSILYYTLGVITTVVEYGTTEPASLEKAAIIAAILTPISGLQAVVIKFYNERKKSEDK